MKVSWFLTKLLSSFILPLENDKAIVTARGRPSGIATTIIVTEIMKLFISSDQSLFFMVKAKFIGIQPFTLTHAVIF